MTVADAGLTTWSAVETLPDGVATPSPVDPGVNGRVGQRYVLLDRIGRGGFCDVHQAWDVVLSRVVAIKMSRNGLADTSLTERLLRREAALGVSLNHEAILRIFHYEPWDRVAVGPYLVMEYLPWPTGDRWLAEARDGRLPVAAVLAAGVQLCRGLAYLHARRVLHVDIKPSNLFVDAFDGRAKLGDFGLARTMQGTARRVLQASPAGTPAYMAPEQKESRAMIGPFTDVYLLAATLWALLTGTPPGNRKQPPPGIGCARTWALECLLDALDDDPSMRPQAAPAFIEVLERVLAVVDRPR